MQQYKYKLLSLALLILMLIVNALGGTGVINGQSQAEVSAKYPTLITPAGFAFSIWSLIYISLIAAFVLLFVKAKGQSIAEVSPRVHQLFWLNAVLNILWIILFSYEWIGLSALLCFGILLTAVLLVQRRSEFQGQVKWLFPLAFGLCSGWLMIATVVNIAAWLVSISGTGFGLAAEPWAIITSLLACAIAAYVAWKINNFIFPLPIAWAFFATHRELVQQSQAATLASVALIIMAVQIALALFLGSKNHGRL